MKQFTVNSFQFSEPAIWALALPTTYYLLPTPATGGRN